MPGSNSVIRRYTPPTCTLEILAQSSPLSRWMGQTVLNQLCFELHFDDPTLPEELRIPIKGDRDQLEALCHAVTKYIQELLQKSVDSFCLTSLESEPSSKTSEKPELKNKDDELGSTSSPKTPNPSSMGILEATIYLESSDNLTHKLYLGSLANQTSGLTIQLSLLQLFDLATALDEYSTDVITLPNLTSEKSIIPMLPTWTPVAAVIALALGLTPLTWRYANTLRLENHQETAKNNSSETQPVTVETRQSLALPSPSGSGDMIKLPNLDAPQTPNNSTQNSKPPTFPNTTIQPSAETLPDNLTPPPQSPPLPSAISQKPPTGVINQRSIPSVTSRNLPSGNPSSISSIPGSIVNLPNDLPPQDSKSKSSTSNSQPLAGADSSPKTAPVTSGNDVMGKLRSAKTTELPTKIAAEENKLFDVPQVAEARAFLQNNWQPPAGFSQTLEYSLSLGVDGTIEKILPLNQPAREYIDKTGIPEIGKPFVSTNKSGQNLRIRVVLSPDGKVQTFPETP